MRAWSRVCWGLVWQWFPRCGDMLRACVLWCVRLSGPLYPVGKFVWVCVVKPACVCQAVHSAWGPVFPWAC